MFLEHLRQFLLIFQMFTLVIHATLVSKCRQYEDFSVTTGTAKEFIMKPLQTAWEMQPQLKRRGRIAPHFFHFAHHRKLTVMGTPSGKCAACSCTICKDFWDRHFYQHATIPSNTHLNNTDESWYSVYFRLTTLHGLKYLGDQKNHMLLRVFWGLAFIAAILTSAFFISNVYTTWIETPVIVSMASQSREIQTIPFPAITICPPMLLTRKIARRYLNASDKNFDFKENIVDLFCDTGTLNWNKDDDKEHLEILLEMQNELRLTCGYIFKNSTIRINSNDEGSYAQYVFRNPTHSYNERYCCTFNGVLPHFMFRDMQVELM